MTYRTYLTGAGGTAALDVALAPLTISSITAGAVYQVGTIEGTFAPSVSSGRFTLTAGEYMLEGMPWSTTTTANVDYQFYLDTGSGFATIGEAGRTQTAADTANGLMNPAYCYFEVPQGETYELELRVVAVSGTPANAGGHVTLWRS